MKTRSINSASAPAPMGGYAQAYEVVEAKRLLYISGQIPQSKDGVVPPTFDAQARMAWANVRAQLDAAGMTIENLVKVTTFLASRDHALSNRALRQEFMGMHTPALTVIICGIFDERWLLEIEAIAAE